MDQALCGHGGAPGGRGHSIPTMRPKRDPFARRDRTDADSGAYSWAGGAVALVVLVGVVLLDFLLPRRFVLIEFYGAAPMIAASTLRWRLTGSLALAAVAAAVVAGAVDDRNLSSAGILLAIGSVAVAGGVASVVAYVKERPERRLEAMTEVAQVAERAIVRATPIVLPDLDVSVTYRSAAHLAMIGGDLYEAADTPWGPRLLIGDARGKGLPAVQLASVVLGAFRHAALTEPDLERLVDDLDHTVKAFAGAEDFVTALVVEVAPVEVRLVSCGHPWPLIGPPRYVRPIELEPSLPLGLGGPHRVQVKPFPTRQVFIAYTDGLVDVPSPEGHSLRIEQLASLVDTWDAEGAMKELVSAVGDHVRGELVDDVTILAMSRTTG